jgi:hypothetical protein
MQGSMKGRIAVPLLSALVATSAFAMPRPGGQQAAGQFPRGYVSARGGYPGGRGMGGFGRSGYAVPRGYTGGYSPGLSGAQYRHPRAGYGTGYGHGYGTAMAMDMVTATAMATTDTGTRTTGTGTTPTTATTPITAAMAITRGAMRGHRVRLLLRRGISRAVCVLCPYAYSAPYPYAWVDPQPARPATRRPALIPIAGSSSKATFGNGRAATPRDARRCLRVGRRRVPWTARQLSRLALTARTPSHRSRPAWLPRHGPRSQRACRPRQLRADRSRAFLSRPAPLECRRWTSGDRRADATRSRGRRWGVNPWRAC